MIPSTKPQTNSQWWKSAVIYEIAPISFQDTNGDGKGDLNGIESRIDYLQWLGVDAVWLTPLFVSPMLDFGYDIADYCEVDPVFGTMEDFDRLVAVLQGRGIKLILDFVPNHTSDQHPWFLNSRSSRNSAKRDWYVWSDPSASGRPPNNWLSRFGGSAWCWDDASGQYYYHAFLKEQPDLNWRNPEVRPRWRKYCASGCAAVSTVFVSMQARFWRKITCCAMIRKIQTRTKPSPRRKD